MNFNDKFLNLCFKVGKMLFSVLLVLAIITTICLFGRTAYLALKTNSNTITYNYEAKSLLNEMLIDAGLEEPAEVTTEKVDNKVNQMDKAIDEYCKKQNISTNLTSQVKNIVANLDEDQQKSFWNNFVKYYESFIKEFKKYWTTIKDKKVEDVDKMLNNVRNDMFSEVFNEYLQEYNTEYQTVEAKKNADMADRNMSFIAFLISLGIFILFLFLPILIRIEENTRK
jgi:hypothetical protein